VNGVLWIAAGAWCGLFALALWLRRQGDLALADLGPTSHDQAACDVCCWASDVGIIARLDFDLWAAELQERAS
jgi:hypothetical protein